ncbi:MAG: hypothetical protein Q8K30_04430 [Candidatus Gracilibacteria bacterium]|nr:hypothetical protein [Candidatus Gracilibacteria bacterium]
MFEISTKKVDFERSNILIKRNISLDNDLDCFIQISTNEANFGDLLLNNILDFIIDKISKNNTYNDFSISLESINSFIKKWETDSEKEIKYDIIISILNDNNYIFSTTGKASCYLMNNKNEVIELTNKDDNKKYFSYISSGDVINNDIIVTSTKRLLNYLSKSDLIDGIVLSEDIKIFNKNIYNILLSEKLEDNVLVSSLKFNSNEPEIKDGKFDILKEYLIKILDNRFFKTSFGYLLVLKDKANEQSKMIKNIILLAVIIASIMFLYSILSTVVSISTQNEKKDLASENVIKARNYLKIASENVTNSSLFEENITKSEELLKLIKKDEIFINDIAKITEDISILKKQFNKIEVFKETPENIIYSGNLDNPVKILKNNLKTYVVTKKGVIGPIIPNSTPKNYTFSSLEDNEFFIDATFMGESMYLLTSLSKVVEFTKNGYLSYKDVSGQSTWEKSKEISSFGKNLYLRGVDNQIYKHELFGGKFKTGVKYIKGDDLTQIGNILSIDIDGGFYILKKDLSIIKFFYYPYRLEKIVINKLPENYNLEKESGISDIKTRIDLNYVYLLLNNKIWVFKPNTTDYKSTKSLTYIGQIESEKEEIKDFYINRDGEIVILNSKGLYLVNFEISDDKLLIR